MCNGLGIRCDGLMLVFSGAEVITRPLHYSDFSFVLGYWSWVLVTGRTLMNAFL
jgi:hypothetical protein